MAAEHRHRGRPPLLLPILCGGAGGRRCCCRHPGRRRGQAAQCTRGRAGRSGAERCGAKRRSGGSGRGGGGGAAAAAAAGRARGAGAGCERALFGPASSAGGGCATAGALGEMSDSRPYAPPSRASMLGRAALPLRQPAAFPPTRTQAACSDGDWLTFQCDAARTMPLASIDPSLALAFYCASLGAAACAALHRAASAPPMLPLSPHLSPSAMPPSTHPRHRRRIPRPVRPPGRTGAAVGRRAARVCDNRRGCCCCGEL